MVLGIGAVAFFSIYPAIQQVELRGKQEAQAVQMGTRLIEHIQLLKPKNLTAETLTDLSLIDGGQLAKPPPYTFSRIPLDEGSHYSPARTLPQGEGTMNVVDIENGCKRVDITIRWKTKGGWGTVRLGTIVGGYR
jgi:hypothetical protein